jgi:glycosyltransferase involved in cell wall biosynthesis
VIISFFNAEKFLQEAIERVFAQTYGNWELFLVDDGSTDDSTEIAQCYAQQEPGEGASLGASRPPEWMSQ